MNAQIPFAERAAAAPARDLDLMRWARMCLPRSAGSICDRLALLAVGVLYGTEQRYSTVAQVAELTGLPAEVVADTFAENSERGWLRPSGAGWIPVQELAVDVAAEELRRLELSFDCVGSCEAPAGMPCVTSGNRVAFTQHLPRRQAAHRERNKKATA